MTLAVLTPCQVEAGACISARFHDWQDAGCNQNYAGVGGAVSGQSGAGGTQAHCTGCTGMPRWWVSEPYENLCLADTPLSYRTSSGQEMAFSFYYRQRCQLPGPDEVPGFYAAPYPSHEMLDYYAQYARNYSLTNAVWGHDWMQDIVFWDAHWEQQPLGQPFSKEYEAFVFGAQGDLQYLYSNINSQIALQDPQSQAQLGPLSALGYPTVNSAVADGNGIYWGDTQTNGFQMVYPDGSRDVFGLCYYPGGTPSDLNPYTGAHAFLTQKIDPQGRITRLGYEHKPFTNFWKCPFAIAYYGYRLKYVVDADGRTNTFLYNTNGPTSGYALSTCCIEDTTNLVWSALPPRHLWQVVEIDDPYGRKAVLTYDPVSGLLTNITDAAGLASSFQYDAARITVSVLLPDPLDLHGSGGTWPTNLVGLSTNSAGWITNLTTPYGGTGFSFYQATDATVTNGFQQRAVYVSEPQGAQQFFLYEHTNWLISPTGISPTDIPGQSFDNGTPQTNLTVHYVLGYRNTFHWGRRQFAALSSGVQTSLASSDLASAITNLTAADYNKADLKHWLLSGADQLSITEALSSEQDPSPDAAGLIAGSRTWYNYPDKPSPELLGDNPQISCIARILPDGSSQYITYHFYPSGYLYGGGMASDNETSYSLPDGTVGVLTNWFVYGSNGIDLASVSNSVGQFWNFGYNANHEVTSVTNALNQVTGLTWDTTTLNLTQVALPSGQTTALSYYASAQPPGNTSSLLESLTLQPQGLTVQMADYTNGLPRVVTTSGTALPSLTVTNFWDGLNRLTGTVFPDGTSVSNIYDRLYLGAAKDRLGLLDRLRLRRTGAPDLDHRCPQQCDPVGLVRLRGALQHHRSADQHDRLLLQQPGAADQHYERGQQQCDLHLGLDWAGDRGGRWAGQGADVRLQQPGLGHRRQQRLRRPGVHRL